jgi:predicted GNAT family N-acyltransferase
MMKQEFFIKDADWEQERMSLCAVRRQVFIEEQWVPEDLEWDGLDAQCHHVIAYTNDHQPIGTARIKPDGQIGRMAVVKSWRNRGVGKALLKALLDYAVQHGHREVYLHAQLHALDFYQRFDFKVSSDTFMDAGIPHKEMRLKLEVS